MALSRYQREKGTKQRHSHKLPTPIEEYQEKKKEALIQSIKKQADITESKLKNKAFEEGIKAVNAKWGLNQNIGDIIEIEYALATGRQPERRHPRLKSYMVVTREQILEAFREATNAFWRKHGREKDLL